MKMCPRVKDHDGRDAYAYAKGDRDVLEAFATPKAKDEKDALRYATHPLTQNLQQGQRDRGMLLQRWRSRDIYG